MGSTTWIGEVNSPNHHKLGGYCHGKPNQNNFVWSICGRYVYRIAKCVERGSSWDVEVAFWLDKKTDQYVAHQRIQ